MWPDGNNGDKGGNDRESVEIWEGEGILVGIDRCLELVSC